MGHKHQWCSYPPEGEVRRRKTWDELEGDEESEGASREVTARWVGVPFSVQDETLYSYLEQFS